ncbi:rCG62887 [Rattus norvegicus]|uniref:RCG62887 n=1 Tax=Rattus norvegicus TaxID=10116 RepID=A6K5K6_RAT|nr:rCG62887 [Rattus norvegicus]
MRQTNPFFLSFFFFFFFFFGLVFMTATVSKLKYPPLFFLIVTRFTYSFCQACYITAPYLFCQGVCSAALLIALPAQP